MTVLFMIFVMDIFVLRVMRFAFLVLFIFLCESVCGQSAHYQLDQSIEVEMNGIKLSSPWAGGLNSAQISTIDLDQDGDDDLAVFDRTANRLFTFANENNHYIYSPEFETLFPTTITNWMLLRDFNCDGKKDLFTGSISGISVFVNTTVNGALTWRTFNNGGPLLTIGFNGPINLKVNLTDLPAIDDVDGDGDLDILNTRFAGVGTIEWHQNMSMENSGSCDSLQMIRITQRWGDLEECECGLFAFAGKDCSQVGGRILHDEGKSLLTLDINQDGKRDLLFSEEDCTSLYALINDDSNVNVNLSSFINFPDSKPSSLLFPAAYFEDLDFDGTKDLIVSSNISATVFSSLDFSNSIWQYKNTGTELQPQFSFVKPNLLQENMIDVGSYASPGFADADGDSDLDLFVSYWSRVDTVASVYQYENVGTPDHPSFRFMTNDYLQFSRFGLYNVKIQFTDVNSDGRVDLAFSASDKKTGTTQLYFLYNKGNGVLDFSMQVPEATNFQIDASENIYLSDLEKDGLIDLLVGKVDGSLEYWKNEGSASSFFPILMNQAYLGLNSSISRYSIASSIADLKQDGKPDLLIGNRGSVVVYEDFQTKEMPVADSIFFKNQHTGIYENRNLGGGMRLTTADLYFDFSPLIFVGAITGGVNVLKPETLNSFDQPFIYFWPNPTVSDRFFVRANQRASVQIFNSVGQELGDIITIAPGEVEAIEHNLAPGLYIARVSFSAQTRSYKLIVR